MNLKQILLEQMRACHDQTSWFVTVNTALAGLTAEQAAWKDGSSNNSIWQVVNHLVFWDHRYLNRFKGIPNPEFKGENDDTFEGGGLTDADWKKTVEEIDNLMSEWEKALNEADESKLETPLDKDPEGTWGAYIAHINIHNAYHIGQVVTLRKQQGSWDKTKGVN
jgi:uncharacterized damage-inducible protein DinB